MSVAILADIHGNLRALRAVLDDLKLTAPDIVVHGGDLSFGGAQPAEIVDEIRSLGWPGVYGNADELLWSNHRINKMADDRPAFVPIAAALREIVEWTLPRIGEDRVAWLRQLPMAHRGEQFAVVHASVEDVWVSPMADTSDDELQRAYNSLRAPIVVYGHIHVPFVRRMTGLTVANCGSVSQSYDGDRRASYLLMTDDQIEIRRVEYDVESEARDLAKSGLPHAKWLSQILLAGKYCPLE